MASLLSIAIYISAWVYILNLLRQRRSLVASRTLAIVGVGLVAHAFALYFTLTDDGGLNMGFFKVTSLFFFVINLLVLLSSLRKPLHNLFVFLLPLSVIALVVSTHFDTPFDTSTKFTHGMLAHILLSILAYSLLTIASVQALLLYYQNKQLKQKHFNGVMGIMPPLQTMETLLFDIVWWGFGFLTLSILTGVIYIDDIMAQQLSHKTVFSVLSWIIYAVLLAGHQIYGWRGAAAVRWVLGGFAALMLSYFGSKFVLEVILAQP